MAKIEELKKYLTHEFSSGSYTGEDYRTFQTKYINYLKAICRENHWQLVNVGKITTAFRRSSRARKTSVCIFPFRTCAISQTNDTGISSFVPRKTNRTTAAGSITIRRWKSFPPKPPSFWTIYHFEEARNETQFTSNDERRTKGQSILGGECLRGTCRKNQ